MTWNYFLKWSLKTARIRMNIIWQTESLEMAQKSEKKAAAECVQNILLACDLQRNNEP